MAGLDAPWAHELGILPLRHLVQPGAGLCLLCLLAAMATRIARTRRRGLSRPGCRPRGSIALRPAGSRGPDRSRLALVRTCVAGVSTCPRHGISRVVG